MDIARARQLKSGDRVKVSGSYFSDPVSEQVVRSGHTLGVTPGRDYFVFKTERNRRRPPDVFVYFRDDEGEMRTFHYENLE